MNEIEDENKQPNQYLFHNGPMLRSSNRTGGGNNSNRKPLVFFKLFIKKSFEINLELI